MGNPMCDSDIENLASFKKLVRIRSRFVWTLTAILISVLAGNIYLMSLGSELGSQKIDDDSPMTIVLVYSLVSIFFSGACCIFYAWWANKYLDSMVVEIRYDVENVKVNSK